MARNEEIYDEIVKIIQLDALGVGARIPSIPTLSRRFRVSERTVKKALATLKAEGAIYAKNGVGVFIKEPKKAQKRLKLLKLAILQLSDAPRVLDRVGRNFERRNPGVKLVPRTFSLRANLETLIDDFHPDLFFFDDVNRERLTQGGPFLEKRSPLIDTNAIYPRLFADVLPQNERPIAPIYFSSYFIAYNQSLTNALGVQIPRDWNPATFRDIVAKLTIKTGERRHFGFILSLEPYRLPALLTAFGAKLADLKNSLSAIRDALNFAGELMDAGVSPSVPPGLADTNEHFSFAYGHVATRVDSHAGLRWRHLFPFACDIAPLPKVENGTTGFSTTYAGVAKSSENKALAADLIEYLLSADAQRAIKNDLFLLPASREILNEPLGVPPQDYPKNHAIYAQDLDNAQSFYPMFKGDTMKIMRDELFLFFNKLKSAEETSETLRKTL